MTARPQFQFARIIPQTHRDPTEEGVAGHVDYPHRWFPRQGDIEPVALLVEGQVAGFLTHHQMAEYLCRAFIVEGQAPPGAAHIPLQVVQNPFRLPEGEFGGEERAVGNQAIG